MTGFELLIFDCAVCGMPSTACPNCVNMLPIDPETDLPPDVEVIENGTARKRTDPEAIAESLRRSVREPVCDRCVEAAIRQGKPWLTSDRRHETQHNFL